MVTKGKKIAGAVLLMWAVVRFIPDTLESLQATEKYGKWLYVHTSVPHRVVFTAVLFLIGMGLISSDAIQRYTAKWRNSSGIIGNADLMAQELDLNDIHIIKDATGYSIDVAAFVRMEVAALDCA